MVVAQEDLWKNRKRVVLVDDKWMSTAKFVSVWCSGRVDGIDGSVSVGRLIVS